LIVELSARHLLFPSAFASNLAQVPSSPQQSDVILSGCGDDMRPSLDLWALEKCCPNFFVDADGRRFLHRDRVADIGCTILNRIRTKFGDGRATCTIVGDATYTGIRISRILAEDVASRS
jgi:hypothetical protein